MAGLTAGIVILLLCALAYATFLWRLRKQLSSQLDQLEWIALVGEYRRKLAAKIYELAHDDIARGLAWEWRFERYERVTFEEMANSPRRPMDDFYKDTSFLEPSPLVGMRHEVSPSRETQLGL